MVEVNNVIKCSPRVRKGKGSARKIRAEGQTPVVAYGPGSEPRHLKLDPYIFGFQRRKYGSMWMNTLCSSWTWLLQERQITSFGDLSRADLEAYLTHLQRFIDYPAERGGPYPVGGARRIRFIQPAKHRG